MFQKDRLARTLMKFYTIFQKKPSPIPFNQVCAQYLRASAEVIERDKQLVDRVNEIQTEFQEMGEQLFRSKYDTK